MNAQDIMKALREQTPKPTDKHLEEAFKIVVVSMPSSWIQYPDGRTRPRAIRLRDRIAQALSDQFHLGKKTHEG